MNTIKKILICGIGAIGSIYAEKINNYNHENLKILVDENRLKKYTSSPKTFNGEELILNYVLPQNTDFKADLVIIATKNDGFSDAVKNIENFIKEDTIILSLLNGVISEEILAHKYGWRHILHSFYIGHSAMRSGNNVIHDGIGDIVFGVKDENLTDLEDVTRLKEFFDRVGIDYKVPEDIWRALWLKFMLNVSSNQASAIFRKTFGQMQKDKKTREFLKNVMEEVLKIGVVCGVKNHNTMIEEAFKIFDTMSPNGKTSMLQDIEAGRKTEVDIFAGTVIKLGEKHGLQTPYNTVIKSIIDVMSENVNE